MTKREQLEALDAALLIKMQTLLNDEDWEAIKSLNTISTYLKNNQVSTPPAEKSTMHENIQGLIE